MTSLNFKTDNWILVEQDQYDKKKKIQTKSKNLRITTKPKAFGY